MSSDYYERDFVAESGIYHVQVWTTSQGLELRVELPSAEVVPCFYAGGKLTSQWIKGSKDAAVYTDLIMVRTVMETLSPEVREVALRAVNEFLAGGKTCEAKCNEIR